VKGFFSGIDYLAPKKIKREKKEEITDPCEKCGLYKSCLSPKMKYSGEGRKGVLIIAEAPGKSEDEYIEEYINPLFPNDREIIRRGKQLIGQAGNLLAENLNNLGYDLDRDFWKINSVNCRPPDNRKPSKKELQYCKPKVQEAIDELKPKFIWLMGGTALESYYMNNFSDLSIARWRKRCIPDNGKWIIPLYHPSFVLRNQDEKLKMVFREDLKWALSCLKRNVPEPLDYQSGIYILDEQKAIKVLKDNDWWEVVFDYETNGLNPWKEESPEVFSVSVSPNNRYTYSFKMTDKIRPYWINFLKNENIQKIVHNLKFEDKWSRVVFGIQPQGWVWDTMVSQHILDSRKKVCGLKFQTYVRYGVKEYDKDIKQYVKDWSKAPLEKVLRYGGADAYFTRLLYEDQKKEFERRKHLQKGNKLFFKGNLALADVESNGICIDLNHYVREEKRLTRKIDRLKEKLTTGEEAIAFRNQFGKDLDIGSPNDLRKLLYDVLKVPVTKQTVHANNSVDQEVLEGMNVPFSNSLIQYRKLLKTRDTYLAQFARETCQDGKLHPSFNLHLVKTYRSSSDSPNFQNIPVRDEEAKKITRAGIVPSKGHKILEVDYGSLEVRIMACYAKDPVLIDYLKSGKDMHKDEAKHTFIFTDQEWNQLEKQQAKDIRFYAKNQKVFPYFYGSWFKAAASNLWSMVDELKVKSHLKQQGIKTYYDFENHMQKDEKRFWNKFSVFKDWQEGVEEEYLRKGKISYLTGFEVDGYLTKNELLNYRIQGSAFHCLLWSLIDLNTKLKNMKTKIIGQIHDSIVFDLFPQEEEEVIFLCKETMTYFLPQKWNWINVPLEVEFEIAEIDQAWYYKKGI
jgi:DNA polymerase I